MIKKLFRIFGTNQIDMSKTIELKIGNIIGIAMAITHMLFPEYGWLLPTAIILVALGLDITITTSQES